MIIPTHDNTMYSAYAYCERWYAIRHRRHRKPRGKTEALNYGDLWHHGMEHYYEGVKNGLNLVETLRQAMRAIQDKEYYEPFEDYRTKKRALDDLITYAATYGLDPEWKILFTETPAEVIQPDYRYGGLMDLCVRYRNGLWVVDHKTTSRFDKWYFDNYKLSPQMIGYTWLASHLAGQPVAGVIINLAIVHKKATQFKRRPLPYSQHLINEWKNRNQVRFVQIQNKIQQDPNNERTFDVDVWNPNFENCIGKYGPCGALNLCHGLEKTRERKLKIFFEKDVWDWQNRSDADTETIEE